MQLAQSNIPTTKTQRTTEIQANLHTSTATLKTQNLLQAELTMGNQGIWKTRTPLAHILTQSKTKPLYHSCTQTRPKDTHNMRKYIREWSDTAFLISDLACAWSQPRLRLQLSRSVRDIKQIKWLHFNVCELICVQLTQTIQFSTETSNIGQYKHPDQTLRANENYHTVSYPSRSKDIQEEISQHCEKCGTKPPTIQTTIFGIQHTCIRGKKVVTYQDTRNIMKIIKDPNLTVFEIAPG